MTVPTGLSIAGSPITSSGTLAVTFAAGYSIPTNASQTTWDTAYTNRITSLTTTGTSGAATLTSNTLNIPNYGSALSGYLPLSGGTLTGPLGGTSATFSSTIDLTGNITTTGSSSSAYTIISGIQFKNSFNSGNVKAKIVSINGVDSDDMGLSFQTSTNTTNVSEKLRIVGSGAATFSSSVTATSFIKTSGTASQFLKADGSVDSSTYLTTSSAASTYLPLVGGTLTGILNINLSSGTALNVAGNAIFRGDTGVGSPRQLLITSGGSTPVYLEAKGYGANYVTDFGIKVMDNAGTQYTSIYVTGGNGYVGINQVSASYQLDVSGTFRATGAATFSSTVTAVGYSKFWNGTNSGLLIGNFSAGAGYGAIYSQSITPSSTNFALATNGLSTIINATNDVSLVINNGSSGLFVSSSGKVGINATSPQSTFVVGVSADTQGCEIDNATSGVPRIFAFNRSGGVSLPLALQSVGGNLLVGTTDDSYNYKVYVNGGSTNGFLFYTTSAANQIKAAGTAPAITFSNTITSPTIGGVLGAATAANQFVSGTASGDMVLANQFNTGALIFGTSNAEKMRINSSGNVAIGTITANQKLEIQASANQWATRFIGANVTSQSYGFYCDAGTNTSDVCAMFRSNGGNTSYLYIQGDGKVGINTGTPSYLLDVQGQIGINSGSSTPFIIFRNYSSGSVTIQQFVQNGVGTIGSITFNGTAVLYNATSDYRLKQDLKDYNALSIISSIKTYDFEWKYNKTRSYGVLAHELAEIIPSIVSGNKDAIDQDGKTLPQGVDYSKIVPILIKSIQELKQEIDTLKNK
jgi:hypothetical protein